jgi:hypothetical protein
MAAAAGAYVQAVAKCIAGIGNVKTLANVLAGTGFFKNPSH